ncbi:MAG: hypothetical protein ABEN55_02495, partial [Bradymonadaceae bacterium]
TDAHILTEGPHVHNRSDLYLYFPNLHVRSVVVDPRRTMEVTDPRGRTYKKQTLQKVYYDITDNRGDDLEAHKGVLVANQGASNSQKIGIVGGGEDQYGSYLETEQQQPFEFESGDTVFFYPDTDIELGPSGDIQSLPCIYVLDVQQLDPTTLESAQRVQRQRGSSYSPPGWHLETPRPMRAFSSREERRIRIDSGIEENANRGLELTCGASEVAEDVTKNIDALGSANILRSVDTNTNIATHGDDSFDTWEHTEGREATLEVDNQPLQDDTQGFSDVVEDSVETNNNGDVVDIAFQNLDVWYFSDKGYRDHDVSVTLYEKDASTGNNTQLATYDGTEVGVYGAHIFRKGSGTFPDKQDSNNSYAADVAFGADPPSLHPHAPDMDSPIETIILDTLPQNYDDLEAQVLISDDIAQGTLVVVKGEEGLIQSNGQPYNTIEVSVDDQSEPYDTSPFRVTYATHPAISTLQGRFDSSSVRDLCEDTLVRSVRPSVVDVSLEYSGGLSAGELQRRFTDILKQSVRQSTPTQPTEVDLNNLLAALDEEGLADKLDVQPLIRVTNYMADGTRQVRYMNPDHTVKRRYAIKGDQPSNTRRIKLRAIDSDLPRFEGRGKIMLGGNNPNTQEVLPYEAIYEPASSSGDERIIVLRSGHDTAYQHQDWETAWLTKLDYEEKLEYKDGKLTIPPNNRPYVRELTIDKIQS